MIFKELQRLFPRSPALTVMAAALLCLLLSSLWSPARAISGGQVTYNRDQRTPQYYNGMINIGIGAGTGGYAPLATRFDGISDGAERNSDWTGAANSPIVTGSFWFRRMGNFGIAGAPDYIYNETSSHGLQIWFNSSNQLSVQLKDTNTPTPSTRILATTTAILDSNWHHVVFSFDIRNVSSRYMYLDDVANMTCSGCSTTSTYLIQFAGNSPPDVGLFCNSINCVSADMGSFDVADFWLDFNTYLDLSVTANRRKFIDASLHPVFLGADGSLPTGHSPIIFFSGAQGSSFISINHGTGGNPDTFKGTPTIAPYGPMGASVTVTRAAELTGGNFNDSSGLLVNGNYAYVINDGSPGVLQPVDITNPAAPTVSGMTALSNAAFAKVTLYGDQIQLWNHYLLVTGPGAVVAVDISTPTAPTLAATLSDATNICPTSPCATGIYNNYLYISSAGGGSTLLTVVKIADDATPTTLNMRVASANPGCPACTPFPASAYGFDYDDMAIDSVNGILYGGEITTGHLSVVSLLAPDAPNLLKSYQSASHIGSAGGPAGLALNPHDPTYLGVGKNTEEFIQAVNVSTPSAPAWVSSYQLGVTGTAPNDGYAQGVRAWGNRLYVSDDVSGMPALTVSDITNSGVSPQLLGFSGLASTELCTLCHHMAIDASGTYILMTESASGKGLVSYHIVDGSTCSSPSASEGSVLYNNASHVLQYCNGTAWQALGPVPGAGGAGCSGSHAEGTLGAGIYDGSAVLQYCDGTNWVQLGGPYIPSSGLVGYWKFDTDQVTGSTTTPDSSGNGNVGTFGTAPHNPTLTQVAGTMHDGIGALVFNLANSQYVDMGDPAVLRLAGSWTVSAWVNLLSTPVSSSYYGFLAKADGSAHTNYALVLDNGPICGGGLAWAVYFNDTSGATYPTCYSTSVSAGTWYLITGVWDSTAGKEYLYLNGNLVATTTPSGVPAHGSGLDFMVGEDTCCGNYAGGTIDDVRVWGRALSPSEIANLYNGT